MKEVIARTTYRQLYEIGRPDIFIKLECDQFANSFKARGVVTFLQSIGKTKGLVTFTTGNHGIAVAAIANKLGIKSIIVSTQQLSNFKRQAIESYEATIQLIDFYNLGQATDFTKQIAVENGFTFVPLFDDEHLMSGYSQIAQEICDDFPQPLTIFLPVGSGSLILANAKAAKTRNLKNAIVAVEPVVFQRLSSTEICVPPSTSIADSLAIDRIPSCNQELKRYIDQVAVIDEQEIIDAIKLIYDQFSMIVEGGGAITLAAAIKTPFSEIKKIAVITRKNISPERFNFINPRFQI